MEIDYLVNFTDNFLISIFSYFILFSLINSFFYLMIFFLFFLIFSYFLSLFLFYLMLFSIEIYSLFFNPKGQNFQKLRFENYIYLKK